MNTLRLAITGIVLATVLGTLIGVARLSQNFILRSAARAYVEVVRNVPLLALVVLAYIAVVLNAFPPPNESWTLGPIAVLNVRGASVFWYEGEQLEGRRRRRARRCWRCGPSPGGAGRSPTAPAARPARACGRSRRRSSCWSSPGSCSASARPRPSSTAAGSSAGSR